MPAAHKRRVKRNPPAVVKRAGVVIIAIEGVTDADAVKAVVGIRAGVMVIACGQGNGRVLAEAVDARVKCAFVVVVTNPAGAVSA